LRGRLHPFDSLALFDGELAQRSILFSQPRDEALVIADHARHRICETAVTHSPTSDE